LKHVLSDFDLSKKDLREILDLSRKIKEEPQKYGDFLKGKTLIMLFELASLRTRVSFESRALARP